MATLLVIDDEPSICWGLTQLGKRLRHEVVSASSAEQGFELAESAAPSAVLLDVRLPGIDGLTALPRLKELVQPAPIIVMTAHGDLGIAVEAVRLGASDYVAKPFNLNQIERVIERALAQPERALAPPQIGASVDGLVGRSSAMQEVFKRIALVAPADACVLLAGESGTGKELVARAIHRYSRRSQGPLVSVNIAALNPTLAESELFGHVRGAFTGADQPRTGLLVQADGGTLFLDEVADIPLGVQVKLLRALEYGEVLPVGSSQPVRTNFRAVSATHQDLAAKARAGEFRHDLYYRLTTFSIELPPLRERGDDLRLLADCFLQQFGAAASGQSRLSQDALEELQRHAWHGNVRELRNAIEHALILSQGGLLLPEHLPPPLPLLREPALPPPAPAGAGANDLSGQIAALAQQWYQHRASSGAGPTDLYDQFLALVEPPFLQAVLSKHRGQCASAARALGLHRTTLKKKLDQYGIAGDD